MQRTRRTSGQNAPSCKIVIDTSTDPQYISNSIASSSISSLDSQKAASTLTSPSRSRASGKTSTITSPSRSRTSSKTTIISSPSRSRTSSKTTTISSPSRSRATYNITSPSRSRASSKTSISSSSPRRARSSTSKSTSRSTKSIRNSSLQDYDIGEELGRGAFGVTYKGYNKLVNKEVAIKTIDVNKSVEKNVKLDDIESEVDILMTLSSYPDCYKYIACYYDSFRDHFNGADTIFIVSEFVDGLSLDAYLKTASLRAEEDEDEDVFDTDELVDLFSQLTSGINHIHTLGFAHRDLKPDNILITKDGVIKIIDFGLSCLKKCDVSACFDTCKGTAGTLMYMSPEYVTRTQQQTLDGAKANDIWSLGVVMYNLANGYDQFPFDIYNSRTGRDYDYNEQAEQIKKAPKYDSQHSDPNINTIVDALLINKWINRPNISQVIDILNENK